jgi:hypothetical protein
MLSVNIYGNFIKNSYFEPVTSWQARDVEAYSIIFLIGL